MFGVFKSHRLIDVHLHASCIISCLLQRLFRAVVHNIYYTYCILNIWYGTGVHFLFGWPLLVDIFKSIAPLITPGVTVGCGDVSPLSHLQRNPDSDVPHLEYVPLALQQDKNLAPLFMWQRIAIVQSVFYLCCFKQPGNVGTSEDHSELDNNCYCTCASVSLHFCPPFFVFF